MASEPRLVFSHALERLFFETLGGSTSPGLKAALKAAGLDLDKRKMDPGYPAEQVARWLQLVAQDLYPTATIDDGLYQLGRLFITSWKETLVGKATLALLSVVGPTAALRRMTRNFRTSDNFTQVEFVERGPGEVELRFNFVLAGPDYYRGLIEAAGELTQKRKLTVTVDSEAPPAVVYRVRWDAR